MSIEEFARIAPVEPLTVNKNTNPRVKARESGGNSRILFRIK